MELAPNLTEVQLQIACQKSNYQFLPENVIYFSYISIGPMVSMPVIAGTKGPHNVELSCPGLDADKLCKVIIYVKADTFGSRSVATGQLQRLVGRFDKVQRISKLASQPNFWYIFHMRFFTLFRYVTNINMPAFIH